MHLTEHARLVPLLLPLAVAQLRVLSPRELITDFAESQGMIYGSTAPFGAPTYGERILGELRLGADDCEALQGEVSHHTHSSGERLADIRVVHRSHTSGCSFVKQVLAAEKYGAGAVIIVDYESAAKTQKQLIEEVVRDDGNGYKIKIPSMLISYTDGSKLYKVARYAVEGSVVVEMSWDVPQARFVVADFWMSAGSRETQHFMKEFTESAEKLEYHLDFIPHYHVWSPTSDRERGDMCSLSKDNKWHCAPDPDGFGPITGADVLAEDVRQLCLWFLTSKRDPQIGGKYSKPFWDYVHRLPDECPLGSSSPLTRFGEACSYKLMTSVLRGNEVNSDKVQSCVNENAGNFLDEQVTRVAWSPQALRINGWRFRGALDPQTVVRAVCAGFSRHVDVCDELLAGNFFHRKILYTKRTVEAYFSDETFYILLFLIFVMGGVNMYLYRRGITRLINRLVRDEVMLEVRSQISKPREMDYARF